MVYHTKGLHESDNKYLKVIPKIKVNKQSSSMSEAFLQQLLTKLSLTF